MPPSRRRSPGVRRRCRTARWGRAPETKVRRQERGAASVRQRAMQAVATAQARQPASSLCPTSAADRKFREPLSERTRVMARNVLTPSVRFPRPYPADFHWTVEPLKSPPEISLKGAPSWARSLSTPCTRQETLSCASSAPTSSSSW
ncbi:39S ribosomal protein L23, mitochondrial isoform X2 [Dromiciops gliroides]|uniref:39S ribosomal protein L23, mitochondrial isoform X2 n=1 Tax=Dromiciops gliroides TaxID=33562 RepID=UPI001CC81C4A|nr:39S ribosomal protein L23, mitochondrial isoform X2 [Dromiciops gliroides]